MGIKLIILLCTLSVSHSQYNGKVAMPGEVSYQITILKNQIINQIEIHCGGALVRPKWVLTTGHCAADMETHHLSVKDFLAIAGKYNMDSDNWNNHYEEKREIYNFHIHEKYEHHTIRLISAYDIALLNLTEAFHLGRWFTLISLPQEKDILSDQAAVSGWNFIKNRNMTRFEVSSVLRVAILRILGPKTCLTVVNQINMENDSPISLKLLEKNVICTGPLFSATPICIGDSGGPLVATNDRTIIGIVSYVRSLTSKIGEGPAIYTRVSSFLPWIRSVLNM